MKSIIFPAIKHTIVLLIFFSVLYPLNVWAIAQLSPNHGKGEKITFQQASNATTFDYKNLGEVFNSDNYFWSRPSAVEYNAAGSCGSDKGPTNPDYLLLVQSRIDTFLVHHPYLKKQDVPAEMVTASGSGLDPHISPNSAVIQVKRIATARKLSEESVSQLVQKHVEKPLLGLFGTSVINVLQLNIALDQLK